MIAILDIPGGLKVNEPFTMHYQIQNTSLSLVEVSVYVESSDAFVFSGYKQATFRLLPLSTHNLLYNCMPLLAGKCPLPKVKLRKSGIGLLGGGGSGSGGGSVSGSRTSLSEPAPGVLEGEELTVILNGGSVKNGELVVFVHPREW
jgi:hypothetical protein